MATQGVTTIDFGTTGSDFLTTTVTGQAWVTAVSDIDGYFFAEATSDNDADAHALAAALCKITSANRVARARVDILATCDDQLLTATFKLRCVGAEHACH